MADTMLFCDFCGAANTASAMQCFACQRSLIAGLSASHPLSSAQGREAVIGSLLTTPLGKQYDIVEPIGTGGYGTVYKIYDRNLRIHFALKKISMHKLKPHEIIDATDTFHREIQILSRLRHPQLPRIYENFSDSEHWYLIMDLFEGQTLEQRLQLSGGTLPLQDVLEIGIQLCNILDYLHTRTPSIIFRDLKPANIILPPVPTHLPQSVPQVRLVDFGTARFFRRGRLRDTIAFGSPGYAAPEQYGKAQTTPRSDLYSLGATLHAMLTGLDPADNPFHFLALRLCNPSLPIDLERLVAQLVERDAQQRPVSAAEVRIQLQQLAMEISGRLYPLNNLSPATRKTVSSLFSSPHYAPPVGSSGGQVQAQIQVQKGKNSQQQKKGGRQKISRRAAVTTILSLASLTAVGGTIGWASSGNMLQGATELDNPYRHNNHRMFVSTVAWAPLTSSRVIASSSYDGSLSICEFSGRWDGQHDTFKVLKQYTAPGTISTFSWAPHGQSLVLASEKTIQIVDTETGQSQATWNKHQGFVKTVSWSPYYEHIASITGDELYIWDKNREAVVASYTGRPYSRFMHIAWSPTVMHLAICYRNTQGDISLEIRDPFAAQTLESWTLPDTASIQEMYWSPDGKYIAAACLLNNGKRTVRIWDAYRGAEVLTYDKHDRIISSLAWSPANNLIASGTDNGVIHTWDSQTGKLLYYYQSNEEMPGSISSLSWSPDGLYLAAGNREYVSVWKVPPDSSSGE